jgi:hypothetical protein
MTAINTALNTGIGYSQTWQEMTAVRAIGINSGPQTYYINNTGRPIMVAVALSTPSYIWNCQLNLKIGSTITNLCNFYGNNSGTVSTLTAIIPPLAEYSVQGADSSSTKMTFTWFELR